MILADTTYSFGEFLSQTISTFWQFTGFYNCEWENIVMLADKEEFRTAPAGAYRLRHAHRKYPLPVGNGDRHL